MKIVDLQLQLLVPDNVRQVTVDKDGCIFGFSTTAPLHPVDNIWDYVSDKEGRVEQYVHNPIQGVLHWDTLRFKPRPLKAKELELANALLEGKIKTPPTKEDTKPLKKLFKGKFVRKIDKSIQKKGSVET